MWGKLNKYMKVGRVGVSGYVLSEMCNSYVCGLRYKRRLEEMLEEEEEERSRKRARVSEVCNMCFD